MKKTRLLNSEISYVISKMGHTNALVICDAGLPIPQNVQRIDLSLEANKPSFLETLDVILSELEVEEVVLAKEFAHASSASSQLYKETIELLQKKSNAVRFVEVSHEQFKEQTKDCKAIVRTGEVTPFANVILKSGVVF